MSSTLRPLTLALGLAAVLAFQGSSWASYTFTSVISPGTISSSSGNSSLSFFTQSGGSTQSGSTNLPIALSLITANSSSLTAETFSGVVTDTVTITDGNQTGTLTFSATVSATEMSQSAGSFAMTNLNQPLASVLINGTSYSLTGIGFSAPTSTNNYIGSFTSFLSATTGVATVPEPGSLVLMGIGGIAVLAVRRFRTKA